MNEKKKQIIDVIEQINDSRVLENLLVIITDYSEYCINKQMSEVD